ncbi:MAG: O-antigen ligase family protein [Coriobacteriia bacterium]
MARAPAKGRTAKPARRLRLAAVAAGLTSISAYAVDQRLHPYASRFAGLLIAAGVWAWVWARGETEPLRTRRLDLAAAVAAGTLVLSSLFSASPAQALTFGAEGGWMGAPSWLALLTVFWVASRTRLGRDFEDAASLAYVWAAPAAAAALLQYATSGSVRAGFGNGNYLGAALVVVLPIACLRAVEPGHTTETRLAWWAAAILLVAGCFFSGSSTVRVVSLVEMTGILVLHFFRGMALHRAVLRASAVVGALVLGVALVVGAAAYTPGLLPAAVRDHVRPAAFGATTFTRIEMWKVAAAVFRERPLLGVGPDGLQLASQGHVTERFLGLEPQAAAGIDTLLIDPHSLPFAALASLGVVGFGGLLWLLVAWVGEVWRLAVVDTDGGRLRLAFAIGVAGFLGTMLLIPWSIVFGGLPALWAGLAVAPPESAASKSVRGKQAAAVASSARSWSPQAREVVAGLLALSFGLLAFAGIAGEQLVQRAKAAGDEATALKKIVAARRFQPTRPFLVFQADMLYGRLMLRGIVTPAAYRAFVDQAPTGVRNNGVYLAALAGVGLDEALVSGRTDLRWEQSVVGRALALAPGAPDVRLEVAHLALLRGDLQTARRVLDDSKGWIGMNPRRTLYEYYYAAVSRDATLALEYAATLGREDPGLAALAYPGDLLGRH